MIWAVLLAWAAEPASAADATPSEAVGSDEVVRDGFGDPVDVARWVDEALHHADPPTRRAALVSLRPWTWESGVGPLPIAAPVPLPPGFLRQVQTDDDPRVRRALMELCRDLRDPDGTWEAELTEVLLLGVDDADPRVVRAAYAALSAAARSDEVDPVAAWRAAVADLDDLGPRGRAAAVTIARLAPALRGDPSIDPVDAVSRAVHLHPEQGWRAYNAWRVEVGWREDLARALLFDTRGGSAGLVRYWAEAAPGPLSALLLAWGPTVPDPSRAEAVHAWLIDARSPEVRAAAALLVAAPP